MIFLQWLFTVISWYLKANYTVLLTNAILLLCSHRQSYYSFTLFFKILLLCILYTNDITIVLSGKSKDEDIVKI